MSDALANEALRQIESLQEAIVVLKTRVGALEQTCLPPHLRPRLLKALSDPSPNPSPRDWIEDFNQENGQYTNTCWECKQPFVGRKGRVVCKQCVVEKAKPGLSPLAPGASIYFDWPGTFGTLYGTVVCFDEASKHYKVRVLRSDKAEQIYVVPMCDVLLTGQAHPVTIPADMPWPPKNGELPKKEGNNERSTMFIQQSAFEAAVLPDDSACLTTSTRLPKDHWVYEQHGTMVVPILKITDHIGNRAAVIDLVREAVRKATGHGTITDIDPDAMVQAVMVALYGPSKDAISGAASRFKVGDRVISTRPRSALDQHFTGTITGVLCETKPSGQYLYKVLSDIKYMGPSGETVSKTWIRPGDELSPLKEEAQ